MKGAATRIEPEPLMTPGCDPCGDPIEIHQEAVLLLRGMWVYDTQLAAPVFMIDPDTNLVIRQYPNGQYGIVTEYDRPSRHAHEDCYERLVREERGDEDLLDDDDEEDIFG